MAEFDYSQEVEWGESQEDRVIDRWLASDSLFLPKNARASKTGRFNDFDFEISVGANVVCLVEVKVRRLEFGKYKDVLLPARKHDACRRLEIPAVAVVEFACGTLVEVDLSRTPDRRPMIQRKGRQRAIPHHLYEGDKVTVLGRG